MSTWISFERHWDSEAAGVVVIKQKIASTTTVMRSGVLFGYDELPHVIAAEQLLKGGVDVAAGENVRFLFTSAKKQTV